MQKKRDNIVDKFILFVDRLTDISGRFASYMLVPLVIVFLIEIVSRNVFNHPTTWAYGTCFILGGCAAILGFAYSMKAGSMVRIDTIYSKLPEKTQCIIDIILYLILFFPVSIGGAYICSAEAMKAISLGEKISTGSWDAPIWPSKIVMALSMIILSLQGISEFCKIIRRLCRTKGSSES